MSPTSDQTLIEKFDDDPFLRRFVPGGSLKTRLLRARMAILNTPANLALMRTVLILGESGSGKNRTARVLAAHRQWQLAKVRGDVLDTRTRVEDYLGTFAEINLPGVPDQLVESELFGHTEGAFTGAVRAHLGYFGDGYTDVLFDEVGDASPALQAKVLQVLDTGRYRPVGGSRRDEKTSEARIILATNRTLRGLAERVRDDLLWRARQFVLRVPPLREQRENLAAIVDSIVADIRQTRPTGLGTEPQLTTADAKSIRAYAWPGNVRQLRHVLSRWAAHGGIVPVRELIAESDGDLAIADPATADDGLERCVAGMLEGARAGRRSAAKTLGTFVNGFTSRVQAATAAWLERARPTPDEIKAMFPGHRSPNAARTLIGKWRKR